MKVRNSFTPVQIRKRLLEHTWYFFFFFLFFLAFYGFFKNVLWYFCTFYDILFTFYDDYCFFIWYIFLPFMWRTRLGWGLCRVKNEFWLSWPNLYPPVEPWVEGLLRKVSRDAMYPSSTGPGRANSSPLAGRNTSDWLILKKENKTIKIRNDSFHLRFEFKIWNTVFNSRYLRKLFFSRFSCSPMHGILIWTFTND